MQRLFTLLAWVRLFWSPLLASILLTLAVGACDSGSVPDTGAIVVGVVSDLRLGVDFHAMRVVMKAGGATLRDEVQEIGALKMPVELAFEDQPHGTAVSVEIEALREDAGGSYVTLVSRAAASTIVGGKRLLLQVTLDSRCVIALGSPGPVCAAPETCVAGQCQDPFVGPDKLAAYTPDWANVSDDPCKPAGGGAPVVIVGEGQGDYLPTMDGVIAQVEAGPQGGHHIWVAIRVKNLARSGSITSITGHFPDLGIDVGPFDVIFTFEPDEGGHCKLYGLRFQLDQDHDIQTLLGHPLEVTAKVTDPEEDIGQGTRLVVLSEDLTQ